MSLMPEPALRELANDLDVLDGLNVAKPGSKRRRASIRRPNGKFFPTIPDDSMGFEPS
jgi:hypothetical protein